MADKDERIECLINIFNRTGQRALARKDITPTDMVQAVIDEFAEEIAYLGKNATAYHICRADDGHPLDTGVPLSEQIRTGSQLILAEKEKARPKTAKTLQSPFYLRETNHGYVYKIPWLPAIIGRADPTTPENELVAVDLQNLPNGLRVSRRHVRMSVRDSIVYLELCARNPAIIIRADGSKEELQNRILALHHGDTLKFERSNISLQALFQTESMDG